MSGMAEPKQVSRKTDPNVRLLAQVAFTTVLWAATFVVTRGDWFEGSTSLPVRVALVAIGIGGFLPVVFVYAKSIRMQDEFNQRIHLIALGIAFAIVSVISYSIDLLHQANFIAQPPSGGLWALMVAVWFVTMLVVPRFYR
jgi:hypothetical protein